MAARQQRARDTRAMIIDAFRRAFLQQGFDATTTQMVLDETGLSKGALYHHFASKAEIMTAIYDRESRAAIDAALQSVDPAALPLDRLKRACISWLAQVREPDTSRLIFVIGPSALGYERAKAIEDANSLHHFEHLLELAEASGAITPGNRELLARMLSALVQEGAIYSLRTGFNVDAELARAIDGLLGIQASRSEA